MGRDARKLVLLASSALLKRSPNDKIYRGLNPTQMYVVKIETYPKTNIASAKAQPTKMKPKPL